MGMLPVVFCHWLPVDSLLSSFLHLFRSPFMRCPPGRPLAVYGGTTTKDGDGAKLLCDVSALKAAPGKGGTERCAVYSLGSNGDYAFEEDMLNNTNCEVHTFDCTYKGHSIHPRHTYHRLCLGTQAINLPKMEGLQFRTLKETVSFIGIQNIPVMKIDIEGSEFEALGDLQQGDQWLPEQISIEVHRWFGKGKAYANELRVAFLFHHLASLGFGVISRDDNKVWGGLGCCSEFTFFRVEQSLLGE